MRRFKRWLIEVFLPTWAKESVVKENEALRERNRELNDEINRLNAYIDGLEAGIRSQRRIIINTGRDGK